MNHQNYHDTYIIPPNFVDTGTFFGGMFRARNVIEAGILAAVTGLPVFLFLPFSLTARIIVLCLTTLPLVLFALIGISGESLSSFLVIFLKYIRTIGEVTMIGFFPRFSNFATSVSTDDIISFVRSGSIARYAPCSVFFTDDIISCSIFGSSVITLVASFGIK